jgi:uncharacterized membrane protein
MASAFGLARRRCALRPHRSCYRSEVQANPPSPSVAWLRTLTWLALAGASLGLLAQELMLGPRLSNDWRGNLPPLATRRALAGAMAVGVMLAWVGAALWRRRLGPAALPDLERAAQLASPLLLAALWPVVANSNSNFWPDPLQAALVISAFILALEPLVRCALAAVPAAWPAHVDRTLARVTPAVRRWAPALLVALAALGYAIYMSHYTLLNHHRFNTSSYDLGIYDNQFWNALHGHPYRASPMLRAEGDWSVLKTHAELLMYVLLPFYALHPGPEALLVLQACILAGGAIPIYRFSARRLGRPTGCLLAVAYLLYAPLHGANFYDFHFQPLGAVLVLYFIDFLDEGRTVLFIIAFVLALITREDISIMLAAYGAYLLTSGERQRAGALIVGISAVYFVVLKFMVMPRFGQWWFADMYRDLYPPDSRNYGGVLQTLLLNPIYVARTLLTGDKLRYALQVSAPLAFVPLRWPRLWWFLIPGFLFTLLTTHYGPTIDIAFQYSAYWFAMLFPATAIGLAAYGEGAEARVRRGAALVALAAGTLLITIHFGAIPPRQSFRAGFGLIHFTPLTDAERSRAKDLDELAAMIPFADKVAVSDPELPHMAHRPDIYSLKDGIEGADWILYGPGSLGSDKADQQQRSGKMQIVATRPGEVLLHRR